MIFKFLLKKTTAGKEFMRLKNQLQAGGLVFRSIPERCSNGM